MPPSPELQWVFGGLSLVAVVLAFMTLPTVFQMVWGQPRLTTEPTDRSIRRDRNRDAKSLDCCIYNLPIENPILRAIGVRRSAIEDLYVLYAIKESGSGRVIQAELEGELEGHGGGPHRRIRVPSSGLPVMFRVLLHEPSGEALIADEITIPPGSYIVDISILASDEIVQESFRFIVGTRPSETHWLSA